MKLNASFLLNVPICIHQLTFITEVLRLVATVGCSFCSYYCITLVFLPGVHDVLCYQGHAHPFYQWQVSYKAAEWQKSCKTCLTNHTWSSYITPLVIIALGGGHTQAFQICDTNKDTKITSKPSSG